MTNLSDAIQAIINAHQRYALRGSFGPTRQTWPAVLPSSTELLALYAQHAPQGVKIDTGIAPIRFLNLDALEESQVGYRWEDDASGRRASPKWNPAFIVFADDLGGGKPIIADTASPGTPIWANYDTGTPFQISGSLGDFLAALAVQIDVVYGSFAVFEVLDDNDEVKIEFLQHMRKEVLPILGNAFFDAYMDYFYG